MSTGTTETRSAFPARSTSLIHPKSRTSPRPQAAPTSRHISRVASAGYLRDAIGLGISSDARTTDPESKPSFKSPALRTQRLSNDLGDLGLRLDTAHGLVVELRTESELEGATFEAVQTDGQDSVASSLRKYRTSSDSATTVSTLPTTPGPRMSITSDFSRSLSFKSPAGSAPSTPAHSRSPSPPQLRISTREQNATGSSATSDSTSSKRSLSKRKNSTKHTRASSDDKSQSSDDQTDRKSRGRSGLLRRKSHHTSSNTLDKSSISENEAPKPAQADAPAVPPLPKSFSSDKLYSLRSPLAGSGRSTPVPRILPSDRPVTSPLIIPKKKDELWSVFRTLDADFAKFSSKSIAFKASVVRSSLIPFLRSYAAHSSNLALRPEDLDRRANILNKWWTGLIELLHGRNNQSISGTDRPAILDGISGIMGRPEWRLSPSPYCPLGQRSKDPPSPANKSKSSSTSDLLADSVHQNVRNIFVQNLSAQMAFVVDKMSLRNASASLVTFCGKACAYAFMFVPGMADVLVRLWELQVDTFRRVLQGYGIGRFDDASHLTEAVVSGFPSALHHLAFQSLAKHMRKLRTRPQMPAGTANIEWWGHWLERWSGRESDLFYVFVKHFHILVTDYLPAHATKEQRVCAPGMLLVQAQILVNLDATIHRFAKNGPQEPIVAAGGQTFTADGTLADPDAVVSAFSLPPTNATRLMAENRLIMLIRDFLNERTADHPAARQLFAETFHDLLQTCTTGISLFDHAACYTLLDFLEEALVMLVRFDRSHQSNNGRTSSLVNLDFWKIVWKKMISSHNTMTEIRLYSFLYTVWNTVICDSGQKADICFDVLLDPELFAASFNHWCPMVRAYFMRLLCWRVARHDGDYSSVDVDIFETLVERLGNTWSHYLFLRGLAELEGCAPPLTTPCYPVPNRRLLIVRTDAAPSPGNAFLSFDALSSPRIPRGLESHARQRSATVSNFEMEPRPGSAWSDADNEGDQRGRGIGGFLRNLIPNKARSKSRNANSRASSRAESRAESRLDTPSPPPNLPNGGIIRSATDDLSNHRASTRLDTTTTNKSPTSPTSTSPTSDTPTPTHRKFSFKFSLEFQPHNAARPLPPMRLQPPRLPLPAHQFLMTYSQKANASPGACAVEPQGDMKAHATYCGRALAEWTLVLGECQSFFDRRRAEGVVERRWVETPMLGVEVFRRVG